MDDKVSLNQNQTAGNISSSQDIIFEGTLISKAGLCLDNWGWFDGFVSLYFTYCNEGYTQQWKFLSNGQILQNNTGLCASFQPYWYYLIATYCNSIDQQQLWKYSSIKDSKWMQFMNVGYLEQRGHQECIVQDEDFAKLLDCNTSSNNQFFSFVSPPPLPPSPPPTPSPPIQIEGPIQSKSTYKCLDNLEYKFGYEMLGFSDCLNTNINQKWQFFQNGQIKQQSSGLCISYYPDWFNLMITECNGSDLLQVWSKQDCWDSFCSYKNMGYSQLEGYDYCMFQEEQFAELTTCAFLDNSQLYTFSPLPSPPPYDGDDDDNDNDYDDDDAGIVLVIIIACIIGCLLFFAPIFIIFIRAAVTQRGQQQQQQQQQEQEQQLIQQQQHSFINPSTNTSQVRANSTTRSQVNGNSTANRQDSVSGNSNNNDNNRYNSYGQPSIARRQQQQGATSLFSALNQRQNSELQEQLLERRIQDSLISDTFGGASSEVTCCICLDELREGDRETILPCAHQFHKKCFDAWLQTQKSRVACPLCNLHLKNTILP